MRESGRQRLQLRKLMFVLPNLFTASSIFCGFYAVTLCAGEATPRDLYLAALCILFAMFFDGIDGRVARLTRTQSDFGVELDSLADVMSFGMAPGLLVYKWALAPLGFGGIFLGFAFATCGALRLARFNVMAQRKIPGSSRFFTGLPIPLAAGMLVSLVIANHQAGMETPAAVPVAALVATLSFLMVSNVRYRTFKDVRLSSRSATLLFAVLAAGVAVATQMQAAFVPVAYFSAYLALGVVEEVVFFRRRREEGRAARLAAASHGAAVVDEDDDDGEDGSGNFA